MILTRSIHDSKVILQAGRDVDHLVHSLKNPTCSLSAVKVIAYAKDDMARLVLYLASQNCELSTAALCVKAHLLSME